MCYYYSCFMDEQTKVESFSILSWVPDILSLRTSIQIQTVQLPSSSSQLPHTTAFFTQQTGKLRSREIENLSKITGV